jgi:hypothetical protein
MVETFGPLINLWDGGGKGERFIQLVKPHIPRGVSDLPTFFVRLMERVYKMTFLKQLEDVADVTAADNDDVAEVEDEPEYAIDDSGVVRLSDDLMEEEDDNNGADIETIDDSRTATSSGTQDSAQDNEDSDSGDEEQNGALACRKEFSFTSDQQMMKTRTIYVYRKKKPPRESHPRLRTN